MRNSSDDSVHLEIADIYLKMGLREDARAQYRFLLQEFERLGRRDEALKVMAIMAKMESNKADPKKKLKGLERVLKLKDKAAGIFQQGKARILKENLSRKGKEAYFDLETALAKPEHNEPKENQEIELLQRVYQLGEIFKSLRELGGPNSLKINSNFHMGVACREGGFTKEASEEFGIAYKERQNPFKAAFLLGLCFKEKGMWEEARQAFERALQVDQISPENELAVKNELGVIFREQVKMEEAPKLPREISVGDQRFQKSKNESEEG